MVLERGTECTTTIRVTFEVRNVSALLAGQFWGDNNLLVCFPNWGWEARGMPCAQPPQDSARAAESLSATHGINKPTSTHSGYNQYSQLLSYIKSLLGATRKRKPLRKAPKPGEPDRARPPRVYAD